MTPAPPSDTALSTKAAENGWQTAVGQAVRTALARSDEDFLGAGPGSRHLSRHASARRANMKAMPRLCLIILPRTSTTPAVPRHYRQMAIARQDRQAAAASLDGGGTTTARPGFDLIMSPPARRWRIYRVFHTCRDHGRRQRAERLHPGMLFAERGGRFTVLRLPEMMVVPSIMLNQSRCRAGRPRSGNGFFIR